MSRSEVYREMLSEEDNDLKAMGLFNKVLREEREERFLENWFMKLSTSTECSEVIYDNGKCTLTLNNGDKLDFFPKANKLLVRKGNCWKTQGLRNLLTILKLIPDGKGQKK